MYNIIVELSAVTLLFNFYFMRDRIERHAEQLRTLFLDDKNNRRVIDSLVRLLYTQLDLIGFHVRAHK